MQISEDWLRLLVQVALVPLIIACIVYVQKLKSSVEESRTGMSKKLDERLVETTKALTDAMRESRAELLAEARTTNRELREIGGRLVALETWRLEHDRRDDDRERIAQERHSSIMGEVVRLREVR
jgi:hypothetical protein